MFREKNKSRFFFNRFRIFLGLQLPSCDHGLLRLDNNCENYSNNLHDHTSFFTLIFILNAPVSGDLVGHMPYRRS